MSKHILFVCKSCNATSETNQDEKQADGSALLARVLDLHQNWSRKSEFEIRGVGCLCTCDRPCVLALAGVNKPTYLFADLPVQETASALLTLGELYVESDNGLDPNYKLPEVLQVGRVARIPPWPYLEQD